MRILHYVQSISDIYGSFFYLKKQHDLLSEYGISQYYLAFAENDNENKNELENMKENIYLLDNKTIKDVLDNKIKPDIIHFDDVYSNYIFNKTDKHRYFYNLCKDRITVRTIHDYSSIVCPKYLLEGDKTYCDSPMNEECLAKNCLSLEEYNNYKNYLESINDYNGLFYFSENIYSILRNMKIDERKLYKLTPLIKNPETYAKARENNIIFAGRLIPQKGLDYLLKAVAKMKLKNWKLTIAGTCDKSQFKSYMYLVKKLNIQQKVNFVGHLPQQKLFEYLSESKVMAFSSIGHETYGFSGAEAIAYGVPVVAFDIKGIDEWLIDGETGIKAPLKNVEMYANALETLLTDKVTYDRYRNNCIQWSQKQNMKHQTEILVSHYETIYNSRSKIR